MVIVSCLLSFLKDYLIVFFLYVDLPCVIGLLPGRTAAVYKHVFNLLDAAAARLNLVFEPTNIMSDYEKALIKTIAAHVNIVLIIFMGLSYIF